MPSERLFWWGLLVYRPPLAGLYSLSCFVWQGWLDLNQRVTASKAAALQLGDIPMSVRVGSTCGRRSRTIDLAESNRAHLRAAGPASLEPPTGIEPAHPAWEAGVLPLNYGGIYCPTGIAPGPVPAEPLLQAAAYEESKKKRQQRDSNPHLRPPPLRVCCRYTILAYLPNQNCTGAASPSYLMRSLFYGQGL